MVDIEMPETNMLKEKVLNIKQQEVTLVKRSVGKLIENMYLLRLKTYIKKLIVKQNNA